MGVTRIYALRRFARMWRLGMIERDAVPRISANAARRSKLPEQPALRGRLVRLADGRLAMEPQLERNEVCGGLQDVYWPSLSVEEIGSVVRDPSSSADEIDGAVQEIDRRFAPLDRQNDR